MNIIALIGRLTESPELKQTNSGKSVVSTNIAVDRPFAKDVTDFIPVVIWNQSADYLSKYARKGSKVAITGKLTTRKYEDKNGNKRDSIDFIVKNFEFCERKAESQDNAPAAPTSTATGDGFMNIPDGIDEELPFN